MFINLEEKKQNYEIKIAFLILIFFAYGYNKSLFTNKIILAHNYTLNEEKALLNFTNLIDISINNENKIPLLKEEKENFFRYESSINNKKITSSNMNNFFVYCKVGFGNMIAVLSKILFYSKIIGYDHVIFDKEKFWFLKNKTYIYKYGITLETDNRSKYMKPSKKFKCLPNSKTLCINCNDFFYYFYKFRPYITISYLRDEIIKNLPKVTTSPDDLYIHVRSGDIFGHLAHHPYAQPPLCFYFKILENFSFKRIFLFTSYEKNNPIIEKLIKAYPNIIFEINSIENDIAHMINAYNIVGSKSSFYTANLQLNYKLQNVWDYNISPFKEKVLHLHYDLYKYPHNNFTIFRMEPSSYYRYNMYKWKNNKHQRYIMINEVCKNNFKIIKPKN